MHSGYLTAANAARAWPLVQDPVRLFMRASTGSLVLERNMTYMHMHIHAHAHVHVHVELASNSDPNAIKATGVSSGGGSRTPLLFTFNGSPRLTNATQLGTLAVIAMWH